MGKKGNEGKEKARPKDKPEKPTSSRVRAVSPFPVNRPANRGQAVGIPPASAPSPVERPKPEKSETSLLKSVLIGLSLPLSAVQVAPVTPQTYSTSRVAPKPVHTQGKAREAKTTESESSAKVTITFPPAEHNEKEVSKLRSEVEKSNPDLRLTWNPKTFTLEVSVVGLAALGKVLFDFWKEHEHRKSGGRVYVKVGDTEIDVEKAEDMDKAVEVVGKLQRSQAKEPVVSVFVEEN